MEKSHILKKLALSAVAYSFIIGAFAACGQTFKPSDRRVGVVNHENVATSGQPDPTGAELMITSIQKSGDAEVALQYTFWDGVREIPPMKTIHRGLHSLSSSEVLVENRYLYSITTMCMQDDCSQAVALVSRTDKQTQSTRQNAFAIEESRLWGMQLLAAELGTTYEHPYYAWLSFEPKIAYLSPDP